MLAPMAIDAALQSSGPSWAVVISVGGTLIVALGATVIRLSFHSYSTDQKRLDGKLEATRLELDAERKKSEDDRRSSYDAAVHRGQLDARLKAVEQELRDTVSIDVFNERSDRQDAMLHQNLSELRDIKTALGRKVSTSTMRSMMSGNAPGSDPPPQSQPALPPMRSRMRSHRDE